MKNFGSWGHHLASSWVLGGLTAALYSALREQPPEPEPPEALSAEALWKRPVASLSQRERMVTLRYRQQVMAEHGAWQAREHERRMKYARRWDS